MRCEEEMVTPVHGAETLRSEVRRRMGQVSIHMAVTGGEVGQRQPAVGRGRMGTSGLSWRNFFKKLV